MKHFFIFLGAFLIIILLAVFNLSLIFGETFLLPGGGSLSAWKPVHLPAAVCGGENNSCALTRGTSASPTADMVATEINIASPTANQIISSPLSITGEAKGSWFFEAVFPIKLIGENGKVLAQGQAQAQSDWTVPGFVPFKAELSFDPGSSTIGMLVFANDNPSGLPQNEKQFGLPVRYSGVEQIPVKVYFGNAQLSDGSGDCGLVFPVVRLLSKTPAVARAALAQLLQGTSDEEKAQGYFSLINPNVGINSLTITRGTAKVDFDSAMENHLGGSCRVAAIRAQITQTLEQFPSVKNVIISVNGNSAEALQP